ncbi:MAG: hypothetical protein COW01_00710 [Bdellovibrionales bacterium CG12_big_fil_rev_8_21_14_0_65_38_15]|nr:MAG: hypothetical protein COW79_10245 [Bdellovibrionales bacterium CG22_combo_CG10-13_8_21_14_all_38_13]PIQ57487.1 MAG: hypothetical protein COW01_00710 [Bdellovibrionales bacterium CG12_big_fil_rev_8_21_14_0_65_38_15]PIR31208.1 MAG: hypothetical protein COV38_02190 [Bdellovibrionales bacterium CG11_big_fil_rev_8_21_14_0_20_38_13]
MHLSYKISIPKPSNHMLNVKISLSEFDFDAPFTFFMPVWSPGSYLVREYSRHVQGVRCFDEQGRRVFVEQSDKNRYTVNCQHPDFKVAPRSISFEYEVYCNELTVRTSHIDSTHAFIHGPSVFMGIEDHAMKDLVLEVEFPPLWSNLSTTLKDISTERAVFKYQASDYDELLDSPIEIGCQETDGFMYEGKEHWWIYWGLLPKLEWNLKQDIEKLVAEVAKVPGELPYEKYMFMAHFAPGLYGGLEHSSSTVLAFDPLKMVNRKSYLDWLSLVAHEYFHVWNVKRIRPKALGPFDYQKENYTKMLWLSEGLTVFMDELFVLRSGLSTVEEYLEQQKTNMNRLLSTAGRKFDSLEDSSFNAWIKLYRPNENSMNSTVSYYLKGGLAFFVLNAWLKPFDKSINDFIAKLWSDYKSHPESGIDEDIVFNIIESLSDKKTRDDFSYLISGTDDLPLEAAAKECGLEIVFEQSLKVWTGLDMKFQAEQVFIDRVHLDSPGMKDEFNSGDELITIDGLRVMKSQWDKHSEWLKPEQKYQVVVARHGRLTELELTPARSPSLIKEIKVLDAKAVSKAFGL